MIYYIIFITISILAIIQINFPNSTLFIHKEKKMIIRLANRDICINYKKNILFTFFIIFLCVFAGFRWEVGIDFFTYKNEYNNINKGILGTGELSYVLISKLVPSFIYVLIVYAFSSILILSKFLKKLSPYIFVSLMLFFSNFYLRFNMGIIRQGLAICISLWCIYYAIKKQIIKSIFLLFIAVIIHRSAIIVSLIYFIINKRISDNKKIILAILCLILGNTNIISHIARFISLLPLPGMNRYSSYLSNILLNNDKFSIVDLKTLFFLIFFIYICKKMRKNDEKVLSLTNIYFLGTCIQYIFIRVEFIADRAAYYFLVIEIILLPMIIYSIKNKLIRNIILFILIAYSFYYVKYYVNYTTDIWMNAPYIPYKMFFY